MAQYENTVISFLTKAKSSIPGGLKVSGHPVLWFCISIQQKKIFQKTCYAKICHILMYFNRNFRHFFNQYMWFELSIQSPGSLLATPRTIIHNGNCRLVWQVVQVEADGIDQLMQAGGGAAWENLLWGGGGTLWTTWNKT